MVGMRRGAGIVLALAASLAVPASSVATASSARVAGPRAASQRADFNGDGIADLAVGAPFEDVGSTKDTGALNVIYGATNGPTSAGQQQLYEGHGGVPGTAQTGDRYAWSVAAGDFNGDGFADLAVGLPGKKVGSAANAGAVNILYGSPAGLVSGASQVWEQGVDGLADTAEALDQFGDALAAGDLNGDGFADLAVDAVGEGVGSATRAGAVSVLFGSAAGLTAAGSQFWTQESTGLETSESGDRMGSLAIGDFDGNGFGDLAIGTAYEDVGSLADAGDVIVLPGSGSGPTATGARLWMQGDAGLAGAVEAGDGFGYSLATGDVNGDGVADLAVGVPGQEVGTASAAGAAAVLYGSAACLTANGNQVFDQNVDPIPGTAEAGDEFGSAVALGDLNGDGKADLAVGAPYEDIGAKTNAGVVDVLYGSASGLTPTGSQEWYQGHGGMTGAAEAGDFLGDPLSLLDVGKGPQADLVIGVPGQDLGGAAQAGQLAVVFGSASGTTATGNETWSQDSSGISGSAETGDGFGSSVARGPGR